MFVNDGYPVSSWNGLTPARIQKVADYVPLSKITMLDRVHTALTKGKPLTVKDAVETLMIVKSTEQAMGQKFMEVAPPNPHADKTIFNRQNAFLFGSLLLAAITFLASRNE